MSRCLTWCLTLLKLSIECSSVHFHSSTVVTLKRIDFTGNIISEIEDGAFAKLTMLEELSLAENQLVKLPMLPTKLISFNANHNKLRTKGIKANAFKVTSQEFLIGLFQIHVQHCSKLPSDIQPFVFVFAAFLNKKNSFFKGLNSFPEKKPQPNYFEQDKNSHIC